MKIKSLLSALFSLPKTIYVNFRYLPLPQAIKFPVWCHWNSWVTGDGELIIDKPQTASIRLGSASSKFPSQKFALCLTGVLRFKGAASIGTGTKMLVEGNLTVGERFACSGGGIIDCKAESSFGDDVLIGHCCNFMDCDGHPIMIDGEVINEDAGYHIGNHVWLGRECLVLKGAETCDNIVFGARSVVRGKYTTCNAIYVGSPAKLKKENIMWSH